MLSDTGGTYLVVIAQQFVKEVNSLVANEALVVGVDETVPRLLLKAAQDIVVLSIQLNFVLVEVIEELVGAEDLSDLDELVRVGITVEERLLAEDHGGEHGAQAPHVQAVVVLLEIDEQLGAFEVAGGDADVVFGSRVVEFGQAPVNQAQLCRTVSDSKGERAAGAEGHLPSCSHDRS